MSMTLTPALTRSSAMTTAGTAHLRRRPRWVSTSTAWFMATATMAAASESVTASWVLSRKKTRAATASTPKLTVNTVLSVTCEAGRAGSEEGIAPVVPEFAYGKKAVKTPFADRCAAMTPASLIDWTTATRATDVGGPGRAWHAAHPPAAHGPSS